MIVPADKTDDGMLANIRYNSFSKIYDGKNQILVCQIKKLIYHYVELSNLHINYI